jgi:hypothetical protein
MTAVAEPVTIPWSVLQTGGSDAQVAVASAFGRVGLGVILVSFSCDDAAHTAREGSHLSSWRKDLYSYIRHAGSCLEGDYDARLVMLRAAGLGTDVPQKRSTAESKSRNSRSAARDMEQPVGGTFSATHQVKWDPSDPFTGRLPDAGDEDSLSAGSVAESMRGLSLLMARTCRAVAHACDEWLGSSPNGVEAEPTPGRDAATGAQVRARRAAALCTDLLESALTASGSAKARLIHYKSAAQCRIGPALSGREMERGAASVAVRAGAACGESRSAGEDASVSTSASAVLSPGLGLKALGDWQGWHYDYGLFTALTGPAYTQEAPEEGPAEAAEPPRASAEPACTGRQSGIRTPPDTAAATVECRAGACVRSCGMRDEAVAKGASHAEEISCFGGLVVLAPRAALALTDPAHGSGVASANAGAVDCCVSTAATDFVPVVVHIPPGCIAVQVGEAAQILSGGRLVATPHCVMRPPLRQQRFMQTAGGGAAKVAGSEGLMTAPSTGALEHSRLKFDVSHVSRQIFVLFMQPAWQAAMRPPLPDAAVTEASSALAVSDAGGEPMAVASSTCPCAGAVDAVLAASAAATAALGGLVPSLADRWRMACRCSGYGGCRTAAAGAGDGAAGSVAARLASATESATREGPAVTGQVTGFAAHCGKPLTLPPASGARSAQYTFADFSKATTQRYYGAGGSQRK